MKRSPLWPFRMVCGFIVVICLVPYAIADASAGARGLWYIVVHLLLSGAMLSIRSFSGTNTSRRKLPTFETRLRWVSGTVFGVLVVPDVTTD